MSSLCCRSYWTTVGYTGVSILTRDLLSKLKRNFKYDLFADIMLLARTMYSHFLASLGQITGESLSLIIYIAAALFVVCWVSGSNVFPTSPTPPILLKEKGLVLLLQGQEPIGRGTNLVLCCWEGTGARANPWGFSLGVRRRLPRMYFHPCAQKRGVFWERMTGIRKAVSATIQLYRWRATQSLKTENQLLSTWMCFAN